MRWDVGGSSMMVDVRGSMCLTLHRAFSGGRSLFLADAVLHGLS